MPKVGHCQIKIDGEYRTIDIAYSSGTGFHVVKGQLTSLIGDPGIIVGTFYGERSGGFEKEYDLRNAIMKAVDKYHELKKTQRKIIAYTIHMSTEFVMNEDTHRPDIGRSFSGYQSWLPEKLKELGRSCRVRDIEGKGFSIIWEVLYEVNDNGLKYYHILENETIGCEQHISTERIIIAWTPQREEGFRKIDDALRKLVHQVASVLGEPAKMECLLDEGRLLLPPG